MMERIMEVLYGTLQVSGMMIGGINP